jgi:predicted metal-dependent hydrolase
MFGPSSQKELRRTKDGVTLELQLNEEGKSRIVVPGSSIPLRVRNSGRAKRIRWTLQADEIELVLPRSAGRRQIIWSFDRAVSWFQKVAPLAAERASLTRALHYKGEPTSSHTEQSLYAEASSHLPSLLWQEAERMGLVPAKVRISRARRRWGSCSSKRTISLNWRLIMIPQETARYICVHELAHLRQMNHSQAFWNEVEKWMPEWRDHEAWLKEHSWRILS